MPLNSWIKTIHTAKSVLGLSDEEYRVILAGAAGVNSVKDIHYWEQYHAVMSAFARLGFTPKPGMVNDKRNPAWISYRQECYIRGLWELASRQKDEKSLRAMCKRITGVDDIRFCPKYAATKLILALRQIARKEGFDPD